MKKITFYLLAFFCTTFYLFCQNKSIDSIVSSLENEQLLFEKIFVHTNKTSYNSEDVIWFKVYVAKNDNTPSLKTALVYVSLFSKQGELINTKNVYIKDGVGNNHFELDIDLVQGNYYIQAHTNNMLNFGKQNKFTTQITIGENIENTTTSTANYDIQFFPEGGYFLEGVKNTIGIKALINDKGISYRGKIVNSKNEEVALFSSMHLGMSKTKFEYKENEKYKAIIAVNDTVIQQQLPKALKKGVVISKIASKDDVVMFQLLANNINNQDNYVLLFHQNTIIVDHVKVNFKDSKKKVFAFNKVDFLKGVISVTVLKNNQPILERKFFAKGEVNNKFSLEKLNKLEDSIIYKLNIKDITSTSNISLSVLSLNSNYSSSSDIASAMYLTPYVKGYVENPRFYFNKENINREAYLDLLLLTQGWTQYTQEAFVEKLNPKLIHKFEYGFKLKGKLSPVLTNNLGVFTLDNQLITSQFLNNQTNFNFNNLVAYKGDSIKLAFIEKEVLRRRPTKIKFDTIAVKQHEFGYVFYNEYVKESQINEAKSLTNVSTVSSYKKQDGIYSLETVALETKKKSKAFLDRKAFDKKHRKEIFDIGAYYELGIPEKFKDGNLTIQDYLFKDRGFWFHRLENGYRYLVKGTKVNEQGFTIPLIVLVSVNGVNTLGEKNSMPLDLAMSIEMRHIQDVVYRPGGRKGKLDKIAFFTTEEYKNGISNNFSTYVFNEGFNKSKKYYRPLYSANSNSTSKEIDWKPNLISNTNGEVVLKLKNEFLEKGLLLSIQGFSNQGQLISGFYKLENIKVE